MNFKFLILLILAAAAVSAGSAARGASDDEPRWFVGLGAGHASGNGLQAGMIRGAHAGQFGVGLLYNGENAQLRYSLGTRYLRTLYVSPVNDTYAWGGVAMHGDHRKDRYDERTGVAGAGLGVSFHFGLPFRFYMDAGFAFSREHSKRHVGNMEDTVNRTFGPTLNGGILYAW